MILTLLILVPLLAAITAKAMPRFAREIALWSSIVLVGLAAWGMVPFLAGDGALRLEQHAAWVETDLLDVFYHVGVDGISYPLVLLTALLGIVAVLVSRREIGTNEGTYYMLLLGLLSAIIGVFVTLDLVLFFVFWEAVLVLMFLLILMWGGENRRYAAMRFLVYTGIGSGGLLLAIILLGAVGGTLDIIALGSVALPQWAQYSAFFLLLFAFFVKIPIVPFHTWLPDAHVQAPTAGSILLAGVLLKMGAYGLLRLGTTVLHEVTLQFSLFLFWMGVVTIVYGAWVCLGQRHLKKLIAYSSINHMGFVLVGIATGSALGITGAVFEMVSHGLIAALLFGLAGLIHERTGTFDLDALHGLASVMPKTAWLLVIAALGGLGLPSMSGFIAEFLVFFAAFEAFGLAALIPIGGVILTGGYFVRLLSKGVFGTGTLRAQETDVRMLPFGILLAFTFLLGILPFLLISLIEVAL